MDQMETSGKTAGKNPFRVPENYFDEVNRKILASTSEKQPAGITLFTRIRPFLAAAAAVAVLVTAAYFSTKIFSSSERDSGLSSLNIHENADLLLNEIDITALENDTIISNVFAEVPDISNSEIINYLIDENIDINDIYERL